MNSTILQNEPPPHKKKNKIKNSTMTTGMSTVKNKISTKYVYEYGIKNSTTYDY